MATFTETAALMFALPDPEVGSAKLVPVALAVAFVRSVAVTASAPPLAVTVTLLPMDAVLLEVSTFTPIAAAMPTPPPPVPDCFVDCPPALPDFELFTWLSADGSVVFPAVFSLFGLFT